MTYVHSAKQKAPNGYVYFCIEMERDRVKIGWPSFRERWLHD